MSVEISFDPSPKLACLPSHEASAVRYNPLGLYAGEVSWQTIKDFGTINGRFYCIEQDPRHDDNTTSHKTSNQESNSSQKLIVRTMIMPDEADRLSIFNHSKLSADLAQLLEHGSNDYGAQEDWQTTDNKDMPADQSEAFPDYSASWDIVMHYETDDTLFSFPLPPSTPPKEVSHTTGWNPNFRFPMPKQPSSRTRSSRLKAPQPSPLGLFVQIPQSQGASPNWFDEEYRAHITQLRREAAEVRTQHVYDVQRFSIPPARRRRTKSKKPSYLTVTSPALAKRLGVPISSSLLLDPTDDLGRVGMDLMGDYL